MFDVDNSSNEILDAILKDRPLEEQVKVLRELYNDVINHGWIDEDLRDSIFCYACEQYDIPYRNLDEEEELDLEADLD